MQEKRKLFRRRYETVKSGNMISQRVRCDSRINNDKDQAIVIAKRSCDTCYTTGSDLSTWERVTIRGML